MVATAPPTDLVSQYASARLAEIGAQDDVALEGYLKLNKRAPESGILADRIFDSAIRSGDMAAAVRAARVRELKDAGSSETTLLLFADAWRAKNWRVADIMAAKLADSGNLAFMAPLLQSWVRVAQGRSAELPQADTDADGFFAYYSADQRIYLDLAEGRFASAKLGLRAISQQSGDHVRDVMIAGAETLAGKGGDQSFADALMRSAVGSAEELDPLNRKLPTDRGVSALYARVASALIEQELLKEGLALARMADWISPSRPNVSLTLANALHANDVSREALQMLDERPATLPYRVAFLESRVDILIATKQVAKAQEIIAAALNEAPKSVATKLLSARAHEAANNMPHVVSAYREMTEAEDFAQLPLRQQASYRLLLASALDRNGDWPSASKELEKVLSVDPNNAQALNYLGYSLLERGTDRERATELVQRAYNLDPTSSAITDSLGWAYFLQGKAAEALPYLEKAAKSAGADTTINEHLGDVYWSLGRRRDARYAWNVANQGSEGEAAARLLQKIDLGPSATLRK